MSVIMPSLVTGAQTVVSKDHAICAQTVVSEKDHATGAQTVVNEDHATGAQTVVSEKDHADLISLRALSDDWDDKFNQVWVNFAATVSSMIHDVCCSSADFLKITLSIAHCT